MFMYLICSSSFNSNTANVLSWNARAQVSMTAYMMRVRTSIQLFKVQVGSRCLAQHCYGEPHTLALDHSVVPMSRAVYLLILGPTAHSNDAGVSPSDT